MVWSIPKEYTAHAGTAGGICPPGKHPGKIVKAQEKCFEFAMNQDNPDGLTLVLTTEFRPYAGGQYRVDSMVKLPQKKLLAAVLFAAGIDRTAETFDPADLVGRAVCCQVGAYEARTGERKHCVERWGPPEGQQSAGRPAAAPTRPRRAPAARGAMPAGNTRNRNDFPW